MSLENRLKEVGFTPNEARIYLHILEKGSSTPPQISKALGMPRSNIHYILENLLDKGVVTKQSKGKRFAYIPTEPSAALGLLDRKRKAMEEMVPDLEALYKKNTNKPVIKFYEGIGEVARIYEEIFAMKEKRLIAFASIKKLFALMPESFPSYVQREFKKREIFFQEIIACDSKNDAEEAKKSMFPYYEYKTLPEKYTDFPTDILVWDDSIALMTLSDPVFAVVITNKSLADTYRIQFELMWKSLDKEGGQRL